MMKKLFGGLRMTWPAVILFAIIAGVYTGIMMLIPALQGTSFQDIGIAFEWWIVFAVIVVGNCEKNWEAMLKCFLFFLISQPVIYLVEIVFGPLELSKAWYYYRITWLPATFLTLPGGLIAYYCKKQNFFGAVVLGIGNAMLTVMGIYYAVSVCRNFPHHLLSAVVCLAAICIMTFCIQEKRKYRLIALLVPVFLVGVPLLLGQLLQIDLLSRLF